MFLVLYEADICLIVVAKLGRIWDDSLNKSDKCYNILDKLCPFNKQIF